MKLSDWTDEALAAELQKQRDEQKIVKPGTQCWLAASRIIHHVSAEVQRRRLGAEVVP